MALLIVDITVGWFVVKTSLVELDEGLRQFLRALLKVSGGLQLLCGTRFVRLWVGE
jgi:hypothetical protein